MPDRRDATVEAAMKIAQRQARDIAKQQKLDAGDVQPEARNYDFAPLPETVRKSITSRIVMGQYDADGLLQGKEKYKQPLLNQIARGVLMNGTYIRSDGDRFVRKVQSLLPAIQAQRSQQKGRPQQQK